MLKNIRDKNIRDMNKVKGYHITIIVVLILVVLVFLFASFKSESRDILLLGIDEREDSNSFVGLTDTIIIYHIGGPGNKAVLFYSTIPESILRDMAGIKLMQPINLVGTR